MTPKECPWCGESNNPSRVECTHCGSLLEKPSIPDAAKSLPNCRPSTTYDPAAYDRTTLCCSCNTDLVEILKQKGMRWSFQLDYCPYCNYSE